MADPSNLAFSFNQGLTNVVYNVPTKAITFPNYTTGPVTYRPGDAIYSSSFATYFGNGAVLRPGIARVANIMKLAKQPAPLMQYAPRFAAAGQPVVDSPFASADFAAGIFGEAAFK